MISRPSYFHPAAAGQSPDDGIWIRPYGDTWIAELVGPAGKRERLGEYLTPHAAAFALATFTTANVDWNAIRDHAQPPPEVLSEWQRVE